MALPGRLALATALCLVLASDVRAAPSKLPEGLTICHRLDPKADDCMKEAVTAAFPVVANGLPTLSIPPIDPLHIEQLQIGEGTGPVKVNLQFDNLKLLGLRDAWIETMSANLQNFSIVSRVKFRSPVMLQGPYKVSGSVLVLPITGQGLANITLNDLISDIVITGQEYTKGAEAYIKITNFDLKLTVGNLQMKLENLFNGDKALGDNMNKFLNENWQEIYKELGPAFETTLGAIFQQITARFFQKVPSERVFPKK